MSYLALISQRAGNLSRYSTWIGLSLIAATPRILAAFWLPNEEGDPYAYVQAIDMMRASIIGGSFTISELFGFWLPLYQFICAIITTVIGDPLYVSKLVSAVCGTGVCLLVFALSEQITANRMASLFAFALIALNPIHIMYSGFSMSDVPHALLVAGSLYFAIRNRWILAAGLVAVGGLMRPESWLFILLLPLLQFFLQRRVSVIAFLLTLSSPLIWMYISWSATGNALEYFIVRRDYIMELLSRDPSLASFSAPHVMANLQTMLYSTGHAVLIACIVASLILARRALRQSDHGISESSSGLVLTLAYFFSSLGFLLFAYFTRNQPAIFARYCLVLFALGLPVLALMLRETWKSKTVWMRSACGLFLVLCLWQWTVQLRDGAAFVNLVTQKRIVADYLKGQSRDGRGHRVFCDDDTIRTLAGFPSDSFVGSTGSPGDPRLFVDYLKENRVEFVVYERRNGSAAEKAFRDMSDEEITSHFQQVAATRTDLRLYRTVF